MVQWYLILIRSTNSSFFISSQPNGHIKSENLHNGDIVSAKILSLHLDGKARVFFNGTTFNGNVLGKIQEGDVLKMQVLIQDGKVFLVPVEESSASFKPMAERIFSDLGLPKNQLTSSIISFLVSSERTLDTNTIIKLFNFLKNKNADTKKAAFSAGLLDGKGVELNDEIFKKVYSSIFSEEDGSNEFANDGNQKNDDDQHEQHIEQQNLFFSDQDLQNYNLEKFYKNINENNSIFELINHLPSKNLHWIVLPFEKQMSETKLVGSVSILLDINLKTFKQVVLYCDIESEKWTFILKDNFLTFECENSQFEKDKMKTLEKLLTECLNLSNLKNCVIKYGINSNEIQPIDLLI